MKLSPPPQVDLFLDSLINVPLKDERVTMELPFFSLSKRPRLDPIEYSDGGVRIRVESGPRGLATIWDKDVLIYCASLINDRIERGAVIDRTVRIAAHDLLRVCQRGTGKAAYQRLYEALTRLRATTILTNVAAGGRAEERGFGWIDDFRAIRNCDGLMLALEITLSRWVLEAIAADRRVLTIDRGYFCLTKGIERRLYELARKHCGHQPRWVISLPRLAAKCGTSRDVRRFKADLKAIVAADTLPDYLVGMTFDPADRKQIEEALGADAGRRYRSNHRIIVVFTPRRAPVEESASSGYGSRTIADDEARTIADGNADYHGRGDGRSRTRRGRNNMIRQRESDP